MTLPKIQKRKNLKNHINLLARGHHHAPFECVDGVGRQAGCDRNHPAQQEGVQPRADLCQQDGLQAVKEAEVEAAVDEDAGARDGEATVQTADSIAPKIFFKIQLLVKEQKGNSNKSFAD